MSDLVTGVTRLVTGASVGYVLDCFGRVTGVTGVTPFAGYLSQVRVCVQVRRRARTCRPTLTPVTPVTPITSLKKSESCGVTSLLRGLSQPALHRFAGEIHATALESLTVSKVLPGPFPRGYYEALGFRRCEKPGMGSQARRERVPLRRDRAVNPQRATL
jgi:hypothetical protein